jgi:DNA-binding MarR family transcriptional regulator
MDKSQNIGLLLREISRLYAMRFEERAHALSLTLMQGRVLVNLERCEGMSQVRLAELIGVEPMAMVRLLDKMEEEHLVERRTDPQDRRARQLYLTTRARELLVQIWRLAAALRADMFAGVNKTDRECFLRVLETAHHNLSNLDPKAN